MKELSVEATVCAYAEDRGWLVRKIVYPGRRGAPDRHFYKDGRLIIVEFKRPVGGVVSGNQKREHIRLMAAGFPVHLINDISKGCALFDE
jgi:hypothetical protein